MNDEIRIIPVTTKKGLKTFIQFHYDLYRDHKFAIPFLRFDEMNTLDPKKNPAFEFCEAQYFLAVDSEARIVGRIAAIINHRANAQWNKKQVRFGWFDFVDNVAVSCALLRTVEEWGKMNDEIRIIPVTTKKGLKTFIQFHYDLYRDHKFAIPFLRFDEMNTLDPKKNPAFEFCEAQYFLAVDSEARIVGRIAAIINHRANAQWNKKQVRFGWFDFVDNVAVSCALLRTVEEWGKSRGMNECVGPLGFTDMDREGLLIEGFDRKSTMYINYTFLPIPPVVSSLRVNL